MESDNLHPWGCPSPWEAQVVAAWASQVHRMASKVRGMELDGDDRDGAEQELLLAVVDACRSWLRRGETSRPPDSFVCAAVTRRRAKLWRSIRRRADGPEDQRTEVAESDNRDFTGCWVTPAVQPDQEDKSDNVRRQQRLIEVTVDLRRTMTRREWAVLALRHGSDFSPTEISDKLGGKLGGKLTNKQVSRLIYRAERKARDYLAGRGMGTFDDIWRTPRADEPAPHA